MDSEAFESQAQQPDNVYKHAMRNGLTNQSVAEAQAQYQDWINTNRASSDLENLACVQPYRIVFLPLMRDSHLERGLTMPKGILGQVAVTQWGELSMVDCSLSSKGVPDVTD